jgi:hypothetical protein
VDSNPTQGMDVCLRLFYVCVWVAALRQADLPSKDSTDCLRIKKLKWKEAFHGCPVFVVGATGIKIDRETDIYYISAFCCIEVAFLYLKCLRQYGKTAANTYTGKL